ncbi:MAG TPA: Spy/CpxP family protein refolding chaperone [Kofleriaceae bacterium]|nr:Spy/CpxP family protein refolding chaperone [Kofleriaceae bacterium]
MIALIVAGFGCGGSSPPPPVSPSGGSGSGDTAEAAPPDQTAGAGQAEDESTAELTDHDRHHHHGGFAMFVAMSLDTLNVTDQQHDAIVKIQHDMRAKMQPAHDAEKAVLLALADGVAAGQIDQGKLDGLIGELATASAGVHDAVADSLNQLHQVLTPEQRQALVDKVQAHFEVWHDTNSPDESAEKDKRGGHLAQLASELSLRPDQVEKIRASFTASMHSGEHFDRAEADAHMKAFAAAFASDTFDAKTLTTGGPVNAHMATWGIKRLVRLYQAVTPVLDPDQRAKAADALRHHANYKRSDDEK